VQVLQPQPQADIEELTPGQIRRAQEPNEPPLASPAQPNPNTNPNRRAGLPPDATPKEPVHRSPNAEPAGRTVACNAAFGPESSHLKLASIFRAQNVVFTDVEGSEGSRVRASVLFPNDSKRRLEVWWQDEGARSGTYLIVISGKSTWVAPKGLKLGMPL